MRTTTTAVAAAIKAAYEHVYVDSAVRGKLAELINTLQEAAMGTEYAIEEGLIPQEQQAVRINRASLADDIAFALEEIL